MCCQDGTPGAPSSTSRPGVVATHGVVGLTTFTLVLVAATQATRR
ncbi:MAG TPA: hypothetical protein VHY31_21465 [Streptosporangiaceae bacterium]|jgi:hypothetical protein|nr:hypothetical protein [Streptosporangiaceae bacterium]